MGFDDFKPACGGFASNISHERTLRRASDQKIAGGWSIEREGGQYRLQSYSDGTRLVERDRMKACAEFVVRYGSFIRDVLVRFSKTG